MPQGVQAIIALAHQELQEQRRHVEFPFLLAIRQDRAEQPPRARASQEVLLVGSLVVGISRREHHALDAEIHHLVEEGAHALGIGAVEQSGVGGDAETAAQRFFNSFDALCRIRLPGKLKNRDARAARPCGRRRSDTCWA